MNRTIISKSINRQYANKDVNSNTLKELENEMSDIIKLSAENMAKKIDDTFVFIEEIKEIDFLNLKDYFTPIHLGLMTIEDCKKDLKNTYKNLEAYKKTITDQEKINRIDKYLLMKKLENKMPVKVIKDKKEKI